MAKDNEPYVFQVTMPRGLAREMGAYIIPRYISPSEMACQAIAVYLEEQKRLDMLRGSISLIQDLIDKGEEISSEDLALVQAVSKMTEKAAKRMEVTGNESEI